MRPSTRPLPRLTAAVLLGVLVGALAALLTPGAALAATGHTVTFTGGTATGLLGCTATPNPSSLRVPAESTVTVVNKLRQRAELLVNDVDYGAVPAGNQVGVTVHRGPVLLTLVPGCQLTGAGTPVTIEVTGVPAGQPAPSLVPSADPIASAGDDDADSPGEVDVTSALPVPPPRHASRLLELVAGILIVGVSIMAIRAKLAERASSMPSDGQTGSRPARVPHK